MNISDDKFCFKFFCILYMYYSILMFLCIVLLKNCLLCNKIYVVFDINVVVLILFYFELIVYIFYLKLKYESNMNIIK